MSRPLSSPPAGPRRGPRIVIAPDAFKGCASSVAVASALAAGFARALPDVELVQRPLADGGEASGGEVHVRDGPDPGGVGGG